MQVTIPAGRHTIHARFTDTPIRRWSNIVSAGSLGLFAMLLMVYLFVHRLPEKVRGARARAGRPE